MTECGYKIYRIQQQVNELRATVQRVEEALGRHPEPCTDTEWSCGWKTAVVEARAALT